MTTQTAQLERFLAKLQYHIYRENNLAVDLPCLLGPQPSWQRPWSLLFNDSPDPVVQLTNMLWPIRWQCLARKCNWMFRVAKEYEQESNKTADTTINHGIF